MHFKSLRKDYFLRKKQQEHNITNLYNKIIHKTFFKKFKNSVLTNTCKSKIKTICTLTGLERSTNVTFFGHSRHAFKKQNAKLFYPGVRKASW